MNNHLIFTWQRYLTNAVRGLAVVCALAAFLYGAFLLMAVTATAGRTQAERQLKKASVTLGALEAQYLNEQRELTPERARELGFVPAGIVHVVYADRAVRSITMNVMQ